MEKNADNCTSCGHLWHGLTCGMITEKYDLDMYELEKVVCTCPSQFGKPSTYELSRQALAYAEHL